MRLLARLGSLLEETPPAERALNEMPPSIQAMRSLVEKHRLADVLPYESWDPETGIYHNDDALGFVLAGAPATGLDERSLDVLAGLFTQGLEKETTIQISLYASPYIRPLLESWADRRQGEIYQALARRRIDHLARGNWDSLLKEHSQLARDYVLIISVLRPIPEGADEGELSPERKYLEKLREAFQGVLSAADIQLEPLKPDGFLNLMDVMLNPPRDERPHLHWEEDGPLLREQMVAADTTLLVGRDSLALDHGGHVIDVRPMSVRQYPKHWAGWSVGNLIGDFFTDTLRILAPFLHTLTIHVPDQAKELGRTRTKTARATQMADSPLGKYVPAWSERRDEWRFVGRLQDDGHVMVRFHFKSVLFAPADQGDYAEQRLKAVFEAQGWRLHRDRFVALPSFLGALPLSAGPTRVHEYKALRWWRSGLSWTAVNIAPWAAEWKGTGTPFLQLIGRRGQIVNVDPFDNDKGNYNIAIAAGSGAGKSFFTQELTVGTLGGGGRCWVIDSGRSYQHISELLGGTFLEFLPDKPINLNPFTRVTAIEEELPVLKRLLAQMAVGQARPLDSLQLSALERAIGQAWSDYGAETTITKVATLLKSWPDDASRHVGEMLFPYTEDGVYARYFEGPSNVDMDNPFVVLELGELDRTPDLRMVVLLLLMTRITEEMYLSERTQRKLCIIDEAWKLMAGNAAQFIEEGYRTARKFGGAFVTVTQGLADFYKSPTTTAALTNADWVFLLRNKPESIASAAKQQHLVLDDAMQRLLRSVTTVQGSYSEVAVMGPDGVAVGRLIVDPFSASLYSTKAEEFAAIEAMTRQGMSLEEAIDTILRQRTRS